ncbi:MAG: tRNA (N6-isopentenyl adenosine(37)-C2)-methylthiotransferase MiaB [Myxococcota bacterium]|nr:tRNA (N6-isopentenyl adenosine(37)-C2)-methylthiotransferase MiaB [Myxococcota bacterium]
MAKPRYAVRTYGCQMNVHDSQKLENLLCHAGYEAASSEDSADLLLVNTCSIRDKAEQQLYSDLGRLGLWKDEAPGRAIGVGGCVAQQVGDRILKRFPKVDFVFGTHNLRLVPAMASAARDGHRSVELSENASLERFALPAAHPGWVSPTPGRAFVTVMEGCDMFCSFCIVPRTRGREISRPANDILEEARAKSAAGVREITLLGQTVNAYGRHDVRRGKAQQTGSMPFAELLGQLDALPGLSRIRYTSPHPLFFDADLVRAHAELEALCPHGHLPVQSGADAVLERMRRRYTRAQYLRLVGDLRQARPDIVLTSDLIVGFPGETEEDFRQTLSLVEEAGFVDHYSFKYSARPGTTAIDFDGEVPPEEAQERLLRLQELQRNLTFDYHRRRVGQRTPVLVEGESRRGGGQLCGRDPYHRVVNLADHDESLHSGDILPVDLVEATPHSLIGVPAGSHPARESSPAARDLLWVDGAPRGPAGAA